MNTPAVVGYFNKAHFVSLSDSFLKIYYFIFVLMTGEKHNAAQRKQREPGARVMMK